MVARNAMMLVVTRIRYGTDILKQWYGSYVNSSLPLTSVFTRLAKDVIDPDGVPIHRPFRVRAAKATNETFIEVNPETLLGDVVRLLGAFLEFELERQLDTNNMKGVLKEEDETESAEGPEIDNFSLVSDIQTKKGSETAGEELTFLPPFQEEKNDKIRLRNDLLIYLRDRRQGWSTEWVNSLGTQFLDILTDCLWYLDGSHAIFSTSQLPIPPELRQFQNYQNRDSQNRKRKYGSFVTADKLIEHSIRLLRLCKKNYMSRKEWIETREVIMKLSVNIRMFVTCWDILDTLDEKPPKRTFVV